MNKLPNATNHRCRIFTLCTIYRGLPGAEQTQHNLAVAAISTPTAPFTSHTLRRIEYTSQVGTNGQARSKKAAAWVNLICSCLWVVIAIRSQHRQSSDWVMHGAVAALFLAGSTRPFLQLRTNTREFPTRPASRSDA